MKIPRKTTKSGFNWPFLFFFWKIFFFFEALKKKWVNKEEDEGFKSTAHTLYCVRTVDDCPKSASHISGLVFVRHT